MKPSTLAVAAVMITALASPASGQIAANASARTSAAPARYTGGEIRRFENNYVACLASANDGVVESAIANSVRMKWAIPAVEFDGIRSKLGTLAARGKTAAIRYKAYLAGLVYEDPATFALENARGYEFDEVLFAAVSARAQKALLGYGPEMNGGF
jgi:hypothetical protein